MTTNHVSETLATYPHTLSTVDLFGALGITKVSEPQALPALNELARLPPSELARIVGKRHAVRLAAALEIGRRASAPRERTIKLSTPSDVYAYARPLYAHLTREVFHVLLLDTRHRLVADRRVAEGGLASCAISPRDVFEPAIREAAPAMIVIHNHPSGDPTPSQDDTSLTRRLVDGAKHLGLNILDHVVIADGGFTSLADRGHVRF